jgi:hypothetical protein
MLQVQHEREPYWVRVEEADSGKVKVQKLNPENAEPVGEPEEFSKGELKQWAYLTRGGALPEALRPPIQEPEGGFAEPGEGKLIPNIQPGRYSRVNFNISGSMAGLRTTLGALAEGKSDAEVKHFVLDLAGGGGLTNHLENVRIEFSGNSVHVYGSGGSICAMSRTLSFSNGRPRSISNSVFSLGKDAESGVGLKMLATQAATARDAGFQKIGVTAAGSGSRDPQTTYDASGCPHGYNGYYTWPRFGYDAPFDSFDAIKKMKDNVDYRGRPGTYDAHDQELARKAYEQIKAAYENAPQGLRFLDVMTAGADARKWWQEHGSQTGMSFDTTPGSRCLEVLTAYTRGRAKKDRNMGAEEFLNRAASALRAALRILAAKTPRKRKQKKSEGWENIEEMTESDLKISDEVFDRLRDKRFKELEKEKKAKAEKKKTKAEKKKTASILVELALDNDRFRHELLGELAKDGGWKR